MYLSAVCFPFANSPAWPSLVGLPSGGWKQALDCWCEEFQAPRHGLEQELGNFSHKKPIFWVNILGFTGHTISATATQLYHYYTETVIDSIQMELHGCVPNQTFICKHRRWTRGHCLPETGLEGRRVRAQEYTSPWSLKFPEPWEEACLKNQSGPSRTVQHRSHQPYTATEHLKCGGWSRSRHAICAKHMISNTQYRKNAKYLYY